jgi:hypothetical protein
LIDIALAVSALAGRAMDEQETGYDYVRYKQLLAEAVDETRRLELIEIMIRENARDRLEAQRAADRIAMTVMTVARVLGPGSHRDNVQDGVSLLRSEHHQRAEQADQRTGEKPILQDRSARRGASAAAASS